MKGDESASGGAGKLHGEEQAGLDGFRKEGDGGVVGQAGGVGGVEDYVVTFVDMDFPAGVVEEHCLEGVFRLTGVIENRRGEKLREDEMPVGGPAERVDEIAERLIAARVFLPFEEAAAFAVGVLKPDVVVLKRVVDFCFHSAVDGIDDAAVGGVGEGGDFVVDGLERFVEILGFGGRQSATAHECAYERTKTQEPAQSADRKGTGHFLGAGWGPGNSEQPGFGVGGNSMNSTRVSLGSKGLTC